MSYTSTYQHAAYVYARGERPGLLQPGHERNGKHPFDARSTPRARVHAAPSRLRHRSDLVRPAAAVKRDLLAWRITRLTTATGGSWLPTKECRLTPSGASTCLRAHVALRSRMKRHGRSNMSLRRAMDRPMPSRVERHASCPMSLGASGSSDMGVDACRTAHVAQATWTRHHVALHERVGRHAKTRMSHCATIPSDMQGLECRTARRSRATCSLGNVAPHMGEVRDRSACRIARRVEPSDIHRLASRAARAGRATCRGTVGDEHERECRSWLASHGIS